MKIIMLGLLLCLGASLKGQDAGIKFETTPTFTIERVSPTSYIMPDGCKPKQTIKTYSGLVLASCLGKKWVPGELQDIGAYSGVGPSFTEDSLSGPKADPVDVPAIQEKHLTHHKGDAGGCGWTTGNVSDGTLCIWNQDTYENRWTCSDPHNYALLTSVDGEIHTCHRISQ